MGEAFRGTSGSRRLGRSGGLVAFLAGAVLALGGCHGGVQRQAEGPVLRVASQKGSTKAMVLASHVLDGAPYTVQWSEFPSAQTLLEALDDGAVDLGGAGDAPFLFAYANNPKLKVVQAGTIAGGGHEVAVLVQASSPIHSVADLRGRRVATGKGSIGHYLLLRLLQAAHVRPKEVQIVFLSPSDAKAALTNGAVDAWSTWSPYTLLETMHGGGRKVADGSGVLTSYLFMASSDASIASHRSQISDFLHRLAQAERWSHDHASDLGGVLQRETGLPQDVADRVAAIYRPEPRPIDPGLVAEERDVLAQYRDAGVIPFAPKVDGAFDPSFNGALKP